MNQHPEDVLLRLMLEMRGAAGGFGSWERLQQALDSILSPGELLAVEVYRWHQDNFILLCQAGEATSPVTFEEGISARLQEGKSGQDGRGFLVYPLLNPSSELIGGLALQTLPGRKNSSGFIRQLTIHLSYLLESSFDYSNREVQERAHFGLRRVLEKLVHSQRPVEVLRPLLLEMVAHLGANGAGLFSYHKESHTLQMVEMVSYRRPGDELQDFQFDPFTHSVPADITPYWDRLRTEREPFILDANNPDHERYFWPGTRDWHLSQNEPLGVSFRLSLGARALGFIGLTFSESRRPNLEALRLAEPFAQEASIALGLIEMSESAQSALRQSQAKELERANSTIHRGLQAIASERTPKQALGKILRVVADYLETDSGALWLLDKRTGRFTVTMVLAGKAVVSQTDQLGPEWPIERDLQWRRHIHEKRPVVYRVSELTPRSARAFFKKLGVEMLLGIPLFSGKRVLGSITLRFPRIHNFSKNSLELAQAVSHQATMALQLHELTTRAEELAIAGERSRLAGEFHDTVAQGLVAAQSHLSAARGFLSRFALDDPSLKMALHHLQMAEELARSSLRDTRHSLAGLQPLALANSSLSSALRSHTEKACAAFSCKCRWKLSGHEPNLTPDIEGELFRIAQEAVNNALRHAKARSLSVNLMFLPKLVKLTISDNGIGLKESIQSEGYGLRLMRERADRIGATLQLVQPESGGTQWNLTWSPPNS